VKPASTSADWVASPATSETPWRQSIALAGTGLALLASLALLGADTYHLVRGHVLLYGAVGAAAFVAGGLAPRVSLGLTAFALPLLPTLPMQVGAALGTPVALTAGLGLDLAAGVAWGILVRAWVLERQSLARFLLPWPIAAVLCLISVSVAVAVGRNLWQSGLGFSPLDLGFSLLHARGIGWQDDYHPLFGWLSYGVVGALIAAAVPWLAAEADRDARVFRPVMAGLFAAAAFGVYQWLTGFGYLRDGVGLGVNGFQPDIHAFAGHMLLGVTGLWAYLAAARRPPEQFLGAVVIAAAWVGLVASGSRASLFIALIVTLGLALVLVFRRSRWAGLALLCSLLVAVTWLAPRLESLQVRGVKPAAVVEQIRSLDAEKVNAALSHRPGLSLAALRMFAEFPVLGIGQGNFGRLGVDQEFSGSEVLASLEGENAHNYFVQTLAELGLAGGLAMTLALVAPLWACRRRLALLPAYGGVAGVFLGNLAAHSMLVRENLLLNGFFLALLYAWVRAESRAAQSASVARPASRKTVVVLLSAGLLFAAVFEVGRSLQRHPFEFGSACADMRPLGLGNWMYGSYRAPWPAGAKKMRVELERSEVAAAAGPQQVLVELTDTKGRVVASNSELLKGAGSAILRLERPAELKDDQPSWLLVRFQPCRSLPLAYQPGPGRGMGIRLLATQPE
jgi:O-antigen ligase